MRRLARFIALAVLFGFLPQATQAQAILTKPISELPTPTLVQENRAILLERGCVEVAGDTAAGTVAQPADKPVQLYPNDWTVGKYVFCPESVQSTVTIKEGKVKAFPIILIFAGILITAYFLVPGVDDVVQSVLFMVARYLLYWTAILGVVVVYHLSNVIDYLLVSDNFTTHSFVLTGWPFLQGIANLSFIIALLYIAVLTVLRMGSGVGKLIPSLVIGALLINFSLVIGGIFIDASRVVMAAERRLLSNDEPGINVGMGILKRSHVIDHAFVLDSLPFNSPSLYMKSTQENSVSAVIDNLLAVVFIWVLLVGMFAVGVGLFTRYVGLLMLLVVSPLAYAGLAFPGLSGLAMKWWQYFFKFVIYGPVALFILLLLRLIPQTELIGEFGTDLLTVGTAVGLLWVVATVAKSYSLTGADKVMGLAKSAAGFVKRNPRLTLAAAGLATGGLGGLALFGAGVGAKPAYRRVRDFTKKASEPIQKQLGVGKYSAYDDKGQLKEGKETYGSAWAKKLPWVDRDKKAQARAISGADSQLRATGQTLNAPMLAMASDPRIPLAANDPLLQIRQAVNPVNLSQGHVAKALGKKNIEVILKNGNASQLSALAKNKDYIRSLNEAEKLEMADAIAQNGAVDSKAIPRIMNDLERVIGEVKKE